MLIALSACAAAGSGPRAPASDESRMLHAAAAAAAADARPAPGLAHERATAAAGGHGRAQPADARRTPRSSRPRASSTSDAARVYAEIDRRARALDAPLRAQIAREILAESARARLDPLLVVALIHVESSFDPDAVSTAGAVGLMQLRGPTMAHVAARSRMRSADPLDPVANIQAGVRYVGHLMRAFGDSDLALMAYNAGPGRIRRYLREGGVPERFRAYPRSVAREMDRLRGVLERAEPPQATLAMNELPPPRD
jgi:soluble lytic murein transglycosylase-like protein